MSTGFSLKDDLFNAETVGRLASWFEPHVDTIKVDTFTADVIAEFPDLELKQRITHIANKLTPHLPSDYGTACDIILRALPEPLDPTKTDDDFGHFIFAALGEYVVQHGLEYPALSLDVLEEITKRFSMEYAIRHFINRWPDESFDRIMTWAGSDNYHVRRLASEGTRPKLPWGVGISTDHDRPLSVLDQLHADPTRFVTRSVANHLNDISKIDAALVLDRLRAWQVAGRQDKKELEWMTRHALRGLIKQGDPDTMELLGYRPDPRVAVSTFSMDKDVCEIDQAITFSASLTATRDEPVIVDYVMYFAANNGKTRKKVHKWKDTIVPKDGAIQLKKRHMFKGNATTFQLYPGRQEIALQINGREFARLEFTLSASA